MTKKFILIVLMMVLAVSLTAFWGCGAKEPTPAPTPAPQLPPEQTFKVNEISTGNIYVDPWARFFYDGITEKTQGRMKFDIVWNAGLGYKAKEGLRVVGQGLVPFSETVTMSYAGDIPEFEFPQLPLLFNGWGEFEKFRKEYAAPKLAEVLLEKYNVKLLANMPQMGQSLMVKDPAKSFDDLKGKRIRMISPVGAAWLKEMGMVPVTVPMLEVYTSLQRGVIDGVVTFPLALSNYKHGEVAKYVPVFGYCSGWWFIYMNNDTFKSLPKEWQQAIEDMIEPTQELALKWLDTQWKEEGRAKITQEYGVDWTQLPESEMEKGRKAAVKVWEDWAATQGPIAQEGLKIARKMLGK